MMDKLLNAEPENTISVCLGAVAICVTLCVTIVEIVDRSLPNRPFDALEYCLKHTSTGTMDNCEPYIKRN